MNNKHKLVILSDCGLQQRQFDYYYVDVLNDAFDFEFWDCSKILLPKLNQIESIFERNYVHKITNLRQLRREINRLPEDTLIIHSVLIEKRSYSFNKIVSSRFKHRIVVAVSLPLTLLAKEDGVQLESTQNIVSKKSLVKRMMNKILRHVSLFRLFLQIFRQPNKRKELIDIYYGDKIRNMYNWHIMSCIPGAEYYINATNVEKYVRTRNRKESGKRFIVYVDSFFPYHKELRFDIEPLNLDKIAQTHFAKINRFFKQVEDEYNCPIVIAAHPLAKYVSNPFEGREIRQAATDELIADSEAVLMHCSGSISYAILNNKPTSLLIDEEWRHCNWAQKIFDLNKCNGIEIIDINNESAQPIIKTLPAGLRDEYVREFCANIDDPNFQYNDTRLVKNLNDMYQEFYG